MLLFYGELLLFLIIKDAVAPIIEINATAIKTVLIKTLPKHYIIKALKTQDDKLFAKKA